MTRFVPLVCVLLGMMFTLSLCAGAEVGFETRAYKGTLNFELRLLEKEPEQFAVECMSVSEEKVIALCTSKGQDKYVCLYDESGTFLRAYCFEDSGTFGTGWDEGFLVIYLVRSDLAVTVDKAGKIVRVDQIENSVENSIYMKNTVFASTLQAGGNTYTLSNHMGILNLFASKYSRLTKTDSSGASTILSVFCFAVSVPPHSFRLLYCDWCFTSTG